MFQALVLCLCLVSQTLTAPSCSTNHLLDHLETQSNPDPNPLVKYPVLLVPGLSASQIDARLNKKTTPYFYCVKKSDWFTLWLNPSLMLPGLIDCWADNFKLVYNETINETENTPGVETRVPGFGDVSTIEYLSTIHLLDTGYFHKLITGLLKLGYVRNHTIRGAPYDFRKAPNENGEYYANVKKLIEEMYTQNGGKKVVIVAHSMGGIYMYYLLLQQDQEWKEKHIKSLITVGAPWGGASGALAILATGKHNACSVLPKESCRMLHRSHPSIVYLLPSAPAFGDTPILEYGGRNYTAADVPQILEMIGDTDGAKMYGPISKLYPDYQHPGVEIHCLRGTGTSTVERLLYKSEKDFPFDPETVRGAGDGTVNQKSSDLCLKWKAEKQFFTQTFDKVKHPDLIKDDSVVQYIADAILKL